MKVFNLPIDKCRTGVEMESYLVEQITEADFGCEETNRKEPFALLKLVSDGTDKYIEVPESELAAKGISEGKKVIISEDTASSIC